MISRLLTPVIRQQLSTIGNLPEDNNELKLNYKFVCPGKQEWFVGWGEPQECNCGIEYDFCFFGLIRVKGKNDVIGYFTLSELEIAKGSNGEQVERDMTFTPTMLKDIIIKG